MVDKLSVLTLGGSNTLVIRKSEGSRFFITTSDSIIISKEGFIIMLNFLVTNGFIHQNTLRGILEQVNTE